jgi:hypothetical protein
MSEQRLERESRKKGKREGDLRGMGLWHRSVSGFSGFAVRICRHRNRAQVTSREAELLLRS